MRAFISLLFILLTGIILYYPQTATASTAWWNQSWKYRTPLTLNQTNSVDGVVKTSINLSSLQQAAGISGTIPQTSLRVIDQNTFSILSSQISSNTANTLELVFFIPGELTATKPYLYFDTHQGASPLPQIPQLITTAEQQYQGQATLMITTPRAKYAFHKQAGGLASMWDKQDKDWISFNRSAGSAGMYRGIPNIVHPENYFHPGYTHVTTTTIAEGPVYLELKSTAENNTWEVIWRFYPTVAQMKVTKAPPVKPYWFLYEGTPGGSISSTDKYTLSNDTTLNLTAIKEGDLPDPEWLYFHDPALTRSLFLLHHEPDNHPDKYYLMENNMTVFGFGREGLNKFLSGNHSFTIGFIESKNHTQVSQVVNQHLSPSTATIGTVEINDQLTPTSTLPSITPTITPPAADFNADGNVDYSDLLLFIPNFSTTVAKFNLNGTGKVDIFDFATTLQAMLE